MISLSKDICYDFEELIEAPDLNSEATDCSPPFLGFGSNIKISRRVKIVGKDGEVEMVRKKCLGKLRSQTDKIKGVRK